MINRQYTLDKEIPKEIRLEVYRKTYHIMCDGQTYGDLNSRDGLCLFFPTILWELNSWLDEDPNGEEWSHTQTPIAFPELTTDIIEQIDSERLMSNKISLRICLLIEFIERLELELTH